MTRLRGWIAANLAVLTGAIVTGAHTGRAHGTGWGVAAGVVFYTAGTVALIVALARRLLKDEGIIR